MKPLKYLLYALAAAVAIGVMAVGIFVATFDPKTYAPRLQALMQAKYQRTLALDGPITLKVFPNLAIELGQVSLSERQSPGNFARIDTLRLGLALLPLLQRQILVDQIQLKGLQATLIQHGDGSTNFDDLRGKPGPGEAPAQPAQSGNPPEFDISGIRIDDSGLTWRDEKAGDQTVVEIEHLTTGRIADGRTTPIDLAVSLKESKSQLDVHLAAKSGLKLDLRGQKYAAEHLDLHVTGAAAGMTALDVSIASPLIDARLSEGRIEIASLNAKLAGQQGSHALQAEFAMSVTAQLDQQRYRLEGIKGSVAARGPALPGGLLEVPVTGSANLDLKASQVDADLGLRILESTVKARLGMAPLKAPLTTFQVDIDTLDLDRLVALEKPPTSAPAASPAKTDATEKPIDLGALKPLRLRGKLAIGTLKVAHLQLGQVTVGVTGADGRLALDPLDAHLYGGTLAGSASVEAEGNHFVLRQTASGIAIAPLLHDLMNKNPIDGHGTVALDITTTGSTLTALKHALSGTARFTLRDGAINGINLAASFRKAKTALTGGSTSTDRAADSSEKTDFSELNGSFVIRNGVAHNDDLAAKSPFLRLSGKGDIDIGNSTLDYLAQATVVADSSGQGGQGLDAMTGLPIPVRLTGPFAAPQFHLEYAALLKGAAQAKVQNAIDKGKQTLTNKLQDALTGKNAAGQPAAAKDLFKDLLGK